MFAIEDVERASMGTCVSPSNGADSGYMLLTQSLANSSHTCKMHDLVGEGIPRGERRDRWKEQTIGNTLP